MEMISVYIAGPLFTEAEMTQRKFEEVKIIDMLSHTPEAGKWKVFNPITSPVNFKDMKPTAEKIFMADYEVISGATHFFFDIANLDQGVFVELGQVLQRIEHGENVKVYPVLSDIRIPQAGNYDGKYVPIGTNQYMIGALDHYGIEVFSTFEDALNQFEKDVY